MKKKLLELICCPVCKGELNLLNFIDNSVKKEKDIESGKLECVSCKNTYDIVDGVPWLLAPDFLNDENSIVQKTSEGYGYVWKKNRIAQHKLHIERMMSVFGKKCFEGKIGVDAGSGKGVDTEWLAEKYPDKIILSIDISLGVNEMQKKVNQYVNIQVIRASVLDLPLKNKVVDFIYSYGVLHHTKDPRKGFEEYKRVLKSKGKIMLYLYENHEGNFLKFFPLKCISSIRKITTHMPQSSIYFFSIFLSPFVVLFFSWPAILLSKMSFTKKLADKIPFNFGKGLFSVRHDLYDRFMAPIEFRFSRKDIENWYDKGNFYDVEVTKSNDIAGWFSFGKKV